ncbi:MAG: hypothetical protein IJ519_00480 [Clostridia bacterium]|nr:hypothetical protein [Clostridia bacterium]
MTYPKILVFTVASWNSKVGANTWATLLSGYPAENIANICIRDEVPDSPVCSRYFAYSEGRIMRSILKRGIKTGREIEPCAAPENSAELDEHNQRYRKMQKKRRYSMLLARELVWKLGKWKTKELDAFLDDFKPDIILHSMEGYIHLNRIIDYALRRTGARGVGYIWDDNFTYKQHKSLGYKVYRFFQRGSLKRLAKRTEDFFAISEMTKKEADGFFRIDCTLLTKPLSARPVVSDKPVGEPVKLLYTGNLYIGRDVSLVRVVKALEKINADKVRAVVDVYTKSELQDGIKAALDVPFCTVHEPVPQSEVLKLQKQADILLFLEDVDGPHAKTARLSFSTKLTDYLSAGKCIFAVGNSDTAPMQYFINEDAAIAACDDGAILREMQTLLDTPENIAQYAKKAAEAGVRNHSPEKIKEAFDKVILK